jgi:hypothetical protein
MTDDTDAWKENAQNGWAALHNIREVLTALAPPGGGNTQDSALRNVAMVAEPSENLPDVFSDRGRRLATATLMARFG